MAELVLKFVQVGNWAVGEVGRFKDKALGDVTAAPERIEQNQIVHKKAVGGAFKHKSGPEGFDGDTGRWLLPQFIARLFNPVQVIHKLRHTAHCPHFVDGDVGFLNVRHCPFHVGAGGAAEAVRMQAGAHGGFGGAELAQQRLPLTFNEFDFVGVH
jgi:hypothetical protein